MVICATAEFVVTLLFLNIVTNLEYYYVNNITEKCI